MGSVIVLGREEQGGEQTLGSLLRAQFYHKANEFHMPFQLLSCENRGSHS